VTLYIHCFLLCLSGPDVPYRQDRGCVNCCNVGACGVLYDWDHDGDVDLRDLHELRCAAREEKW